MAGEAQVEVRRQWVGATFGVAFGAVAGWIFGRVTVGPANQAGAVAGLGISLALVVVSAVTVALFMAAAAMFTSPRRRPMSLATVAAAAGWVAGYAFAMWMN